MTKVVIARMISLFAPSIDVNRYFDVERYWVASLWPFAILALLASLTIAPIVHSDARMLALFDLPGTIPHFPPIYPIFVHLVAALASVVDTLRGEGLPHLTLVQGAPFSRTASVVLLITQHAFALLSMGYFASRLRSDWLGWSALVAILWLNPFTLQMVHGVNTEALTIPAVYAALGEAFSILAAGDHRSRRYALFFCWSLAASLVRHPAVVVVLVLPLGLIAQALSSRQVGRRPTAATLGISALIVVGVVAGNLLVSRVVLTLIRGEIASVPGRAFIYRLSHESLHTRPAWDESELRRVVAALKATAESEELKSDIDAIVDTPGPWVGPFNVVYERVRAACKVNCSLFEMFAETDRRLNRVLLHMAVSTDSRILLDVGLRTVEFLASYLVPQVFVPQTFGVDMPEEPNFTPLKGFWWSAHDLEIGVAKYSAAMRDYALSLATCIAIASWLLPSRRWLIGFQMGVLGCAVSYSILVSLVTIYMNRYGLFVDQMALALLGATVGAVPFNPGKQRIMQDAIVAAPTAKACAFVFRAVHSSASIAQRFNSLAPRNRAAISRA